MVSRRSKTKAKKTNIPRAICWAIVLIDAAPLRNQALRECRRFLKRLGVVRSNLDQFEREDQPAFERWKASHFGAQMTELNDLNSECAELERLKWDVEEIMYLERCSARSAYRRVMRQREAWNTAANTDTAGGGERESYQDTDAAADAYEKKWREENEEEYLFHSFVAETFGMDADFLPEDIYDVFFKKFQAEHKKSKASNNHSRKGIPVFGDKAGDASLRIKELYRLLVRRLHPDCNGGEEPVRAHLWHQVQDAYAAGDIERLETLVAYSDVQSGGVGEHTTLDRMRLVGAELRQSIRAIERSIRTSKKSTAWGFARTTDRNALQRKVQQEIEATLTPLRSDVEWLRNLIAKWKATATKTPKKASKKPTPPRSPAFSDSRQDDFMF